MKRYLMLDDERNFEDNEKYLREKGLPGTPSQWSIVRNYEEFKQYILARPHQMPDLIAFDHDIADIREDGSERTGTDCARWLVNYCMESLLPVPDYIVHSSNGEGGKNIKSIFETYKKYFKS